MKQFFNQSSQEDPSPPLMEAIKRYVNARIALAKAEFSALIGQIIQLMIFGLIVVFFSALALLLVEGCLVLVIANFFQWSLWLSFLALAGAHLVVALLFLLIVVIQSKSLKAFPLCSKLAEQKQQSSFQAANKN